jgi:transcription-repair coupling factor (superfamily II helicase)
MRGRMGRSNDRAYVYRLVPPDIESDRDRTETAGGAGPGIRGGGTSWAESGTGHINPVGFETYVRLLDDTAADADPP